MWFKKMDIQNSGRFTKNFFSLQLQLKTLLEESGGENLISFLDDLSDLEKAEQKIVLKIFSRAVQKLKKEDRKVILSNNEKALKEFEEVLYHELLGSIEKAADNTPMKLSVLNGGHSRQSKEDNVIDFSKAREVRLRQ